MKVDFNFNEVSGEITLTPQSPKEENFVKMCYDYDVYPLVARSGTNVIKLQFMTGAKSFAEPRHIPQIIDLDSKCVCGGIGCNSCEPQGRG